MIEEGLLLEVRAEHLLVGSQLDFQCQDAAGHTCFHSVIEDDFKNREATESAAIQVSFEPAALDTFLIELKQIEQDLRGSACLMTGP